MVELPGAALVAAAPDDRILYVATDDGTLLRLDSTQLDVDAPATDAPFIVELAATGAPIDGLWAFPGRQCGHRAG